MCIRDRDNGAEEEAGSEAVSIRAAEIPETVTGAGLRISWSAYLHYGTEAGRATSSLSDVTEEVVYEAYTSAQGRSMDLFVDEGSGQALVILLEDGEMCIRDRTKTALCLRQSPCQPAGTSPGG